MADRTSLTGQAAHVLGLAYRRFGVRSYLCPVLAACPCVGSSTPSESEPIPPDTHERLSAPKNCDSGKVFFALYRRLLSRLAELLTTELSALTHGRAGLV
jgi:hypothetical protein